MKHISVLLKESIDGLNLKEDSIVVDCTLGYGGHSSEILKRIKKGHLYAFDQDEEAIAFSSGRLSEIGDNFTIIHANFANLKEELEKRGIMKVDAILFDLGVSSPQLDEADRGFSYHQDAKLDMRMDQTQALSAYDVVNTFEEAELADIFYRYGEEKFSRSIAKNIVAARREHPIETTLELAEIIKNSVPERVRRASHPARKVFQAIRIYVNRELEVLEIALQNALSILAIDGHISVITFHSLEDRIVKNKFKEVTEVDPVLKGLPDVPKEKLPDFELVSKKAIAPTPEELEENPRARSAKLRVIKRIK